MPVLEIKLESPLCSGSGLDRPGVVDREVVFDEYGLPWLPGRRLKGLLRDAYIEVAAGVSRVQQIRKLPEPGELFGRVAPPVPGRINVRSGFLPDYDQLSSWLAGFFDSQRVGPTPADVISTFCEIRRQTAIDSESGAPKKNTLRATRILRKGLVFRAEITGDLSDGDLWAVALAAAALREMGGSRSRGLGRVSCRLLDEAMDLTAEALAGLDHSGFKPAVINRPNTDVALGTPSSVSASVLQYEIRLEDNAIFPALRGDPNIATTEEYVPGTVIHGWFARRYLRRHSDVADDLFRHVFTSGDVRFLDGLLMKVSRRFSTLPHSIRSKKDGTGWVDLTRQESKEIRRVRRLCDMNSLVGHAAHLIQSETEVSLHLHHARAKHLLLQRAVGQEQAPKSGIAPEEAGAFFSYQSIRAGQVFRGEIRGQPTLLTHIRELAHDGAVLWLGRSKSAQYGGRAVWRWLDAPEAVPLASATTVTVVLDSPLIALNPATGHPTPRFPIEELQAALGCETLKIVRQYVRTEWQGGYLSHQQLPRQQLPALATGSVFVLEGQHVTSEQLTAAAQRSYGLRREQGYGAIRILPGSSVTQQTIATHELDVGDSVQKPAGAAAVLAEKLFRENVQQTTRHEAFQKARHESANLPAKHLLHRLRGMVLAQSEAEFQTSIGELRERAKRQLDRCRIDGIRLSEILKQNWADLAGAMAQEAYSRVPWKTVFGSLPTVDVSVGQLYLAELLACTAKRAGKE
jgi:CRISPR-associated protein Csx10